MEENYVPMRTVLVSNFEFFNIKDLLPLRLNSGLMMPLAIIVKPDFHYIVENKKVVAWAFEYRNLFNVFVSEEFRGLGLAKDLYYSFDNYQSFIGNKASFKLLKDVRSVRWDLEDTKPYIKYYWAKYCLGKDMDSEESLLEFSEDMRNVSI